MRIAVKITIAIETLIATQEVIVIETLETLIVTPEVTTIETLEALIVTPEVTIRAAPFCWPSLASGFEELGSTWGLGLLGSWFRV